MFWRNSFFLSELIVNRILIVSIVVNKNYYKYYYYYYYYVHSSPFADVNSFLNPSIITGENYRPDLLFLIQSKCLYVLELKVGFESNLNNNAVRKKEKYLNLIKEMSRNYRCVKFVLAFSPTNAQPRPLGFSLKKMGKALGRMLTNALRF